MTITTVLKEHGRKQFHQIGVRLNDKGRNWKKPICKVLELNLLKRILFKDQRVCWQISV